MPLLQIFAAEEERSYGGLLTAVFGFKQDRADLFYSEVFIYGPFSAISHSGKPRSVRKHDLLNLMMVSSTRRKPVFQCNRVFGYYGIGRFHAGRRCQRRGLLWRIVPSGFG